MQAHHLIPELTWNRNANFLDNIGLPKEMRDHFTNGLLMADSRVKADSLGQKLFHNSRHREYTKMVEKKLGRIRAMLESGEINAKQAKQYVESLQSSLRKKITSGKIKTETKCGRLS